MAEYIERDAAKRAVDYAVELTNSEYDAVCDSIDRVLAADVAPVVHGRWIMSSDRPDTIICDCCREAFDVWKADINRHHYCPYCGARMDGEKDGDK